MTKAQKQNGFNYLYGAISYAQSTPSNDTKLNYKDRLESIENAFGANEVMKFMGVITEKEYEEHIAQLIEIREELKYKAHKLGYDL